MSHAPGCIRPRKGCQRFFGSIRARFGQRGESLVNATAQGGIGRGEGVEIRNHAAHPRRRAETKNAAGAGGQQAAPTQCSSFCKRIQVANVFKIAVAYDCRACLHAFGQAAGGM
jgi:hypothetical protein